MGTTRFAHLLSVSNGQVAVDTLAAHQQQQEHVCIQACGHGRSGGLTPQGVGTDRAGLRGSQRCHPPRRLPPPNTRAPTGKQQVAGAAGAGEHCVGPVPFDACRHAPCGPSCQQLAPSRPVVALRPRRSAGRARLTSVQTHTCADGGSPAQSFTATSSPRRCTRRKDIKLCHPKPPCRAPPREHHRPRGEGLCSAPPAPSLLSVPEEDGGRLQPISLNHRNPFAPLHPPQK